jgi:hypothetical protein
MRLDPSPLLVIQPEKVAAHNLPPRQNESAAYGIKFALAQQYIY